MLDKLLTKKWFYPLYIWLLFAGSLAIVVTGHQISGAILFGLIASAALIVFSDPTGFLIPGVLLSVFVTTCYDSYSTFIELWPYAIALVVGFAFNAVVYRKKVKIGPSFYGIVAVAVAVALGGLGTISSEEYFSPTALYYVIMLGVGMVLLYLLYSSKMKPESRNAVALLMYAAGLLAAFIMLHHYYMNLEHLITNKRITYFQADNNLCTFILLAMPFGLYYTRKNFINIIFFLGMFLCALISSSRGGMMMSLILFVILMAYALFNEKSIVKKILYSLILICLLLAFVIFLPQLLSVVSFRGMDTELYADTLSLVKDYFFNSEQARMGLLKCAIKDFKANPLFGAGIGYTGNTEFYLPKTGAMNWYHLWLAQVVGGLGIVGAAAFGYQLVARIKLYLKNKSVMNSTFFFSYLGLFLMSQVNPGEFCPVPYALAAVIYFIIIEQTPKRETAKRLKKARRNI